MRLSIDTSRGFSSSAMVSILMTVGARIVWVIAWRSTASKKASGVNCSSMIDRAPRNNAGTINMPDMWVTGPTCRSAASGVTSSMISARTLRCRRLNPAWL